MSDGIKQEHKRLVAGRARTLLERIEDPDPLEYGHRDESDVENIYEKWRDLYPDEEAFQTRLEQIGTDVEECKRAISADRIGDDEPLPDWMDTLDEIVDAVQGEGSHLDADYLDTLDEKQEGPETEHWLFPQLSARVAAFALTKLPQDPVKTVLTEDALYTMASWFRARFHERFNRILYVEFKSFVASRDRELAFTDPEEFDDPPRAHFREFREYLLSDGFADLCVEYPVFSRLLVTQFDQWKHHLVELSERLRRDKDVLAEEFGSGDLGRIVTLRPLADDTHGDGRAITALEFESGKKIVYKPRSVEAGKAFNRFLRNLNDQVSLPEFEPPKIVSRGEYGWMEWIDSGDCSTEAQIERYYQRIGALVCVVYLFEFTDCHFENVIAAGEHPYLIDAETIFHPYFGKERDTTMSGPNALVNNSALLSLLLPFSVESGADVDVGNDLSQKIAGIGLSTEPVEIDAIPSPSIKAVNTDVVSIDQEPVTFDRSDNVPTLDGEGCPPREYVDEIVDGFETVYDTILELRDRNELSDALGYPDIFESTINRVVYRSTMQYAKVLRSSRSRSCLHDGARFGVELEGLSVPFCDGSIGDPKPWALLEEELDALKRFDPPRFTSYTDGTELYRDGDPIGAEVDRAGLERSMDRIEAADPADRREQVEIIRAAFAGPLTPDWPSTDDPAITPETVDDQSLETEAEALFDRILVAGVEDEDGVRDWAWIAPWDDSTRMSVEFADHSLYSGRSGIALLAGALYRTTGDDRYRELAREIVAPVRESIRDGVPTATLQDIGGCSGAGSVAYGLGVLGDLIDDESLLEDAARTVQFVTDERIEQDDTYDVVGGAAGTILGLLAVHDRHEDPELVSVAQQCGDHLLDARITTEDGHQVWEGPGDSDPLTGFAHGMSGIAYSLVRLSAVTGDDSYRDAALSAIEYEADSYSEGAQNWPDNRDWVDAAFMDQWCHGRSGIGLARLGMSDYTDDPIIVDGFERAVEGISNDWPKHSDHLCCGEAGRAEFLLEAEQRHDYRPGEARERMRAVLARKERTGCYRKLSRTSEVIDPSLFHGIAGIGYTMLRTQYPDELPCLLLYE